MQLNFLDEANRLLKEKGLSRNDLADALGVTKSFISQLFSGDKKLNLEMIAKLQAFFKTPVSLTFRSSRKSKAGKAKTSGKQKTNRPFVHNKLMKAS
jgi:transcriptional regulator with XRE-family HTH domain